MTWLKMTCPLPTRFLIALLACASLLQSHTALSQDGSNECADTEAALNKWRPIRESADSDSHSPNILARELVPCLGSANSELRDSIGYELFTYWLRGEKLSADTLHYLLETLSENIKQGGEENSLSRSFSALILSEVMRADNLSAFMSQQDLTDLLAATATALERESDYRGLVEGIGWVHPVAHMADILWRFSLHSALDEEQARMILQGIRSKLAPTCASYAFNEGDRLARPISIMIRRQMLQSEEILSWLESFNAPLSMQSWGEAFASPEGMAELHNTKLFIRALSDQLRGEDTPEEIRARLDSLISDFTARV